MVVEELGARGSGLGKCEALILHERDFVSFSQVVSGVAVGEIGFEVSRSCRERDERLGEGIWDWNSEF